jgi:hypothetical protein
MTNSTKTKGNSMKSLILIFSLLASLQSFATDDSQVGSQSIIGPTPYKVYFLNYENVSAVHITFIAKEKEDVCNKQTLSGRMSEFKDSNGEPLYFANFFVSSTRMGCPGAPKSNKILSFKSESLTIPADADGSVAVSLMTSPEISNFTIETVAK